MQTREFRREHHDARIARRDGDLDRLFPYGTYEMRVRHQANIATEPKPGALVTAPGPLLCDIEAELAAGALPSVTARAQRWASARGARWASLRA